MTGGGPPRLHIRGLGLSHGRRRLFRDLRWTLEPGGIGWVVGPNGAGKSTLLATLAGIQRPGEGSVAYEKIGRSEGGGVLYYEPGMDLPEDVSLPVWRELARSLARLGGGAGPAPVDLVPDTVEGGRAVRTLSTGERKRLLLDLLLRTSSDLAVLDEPYEHLSAEAKEALTRTLRRRARRSVVIVSTNQEPFVDRERDAVLRVGGADPGWRWEEREKVG